MPIRDENILFTIPIYLEAEYEYYQFLKKKRDISVEQQIRRLKKIGLDPKGAMEKDLRDNPPCINPERIVWKYNRIIGWIEFYANGGIIKADLWFIRAKRISKKPKNVLLDYRGKISDVVDTYRLNNEQIRDEIEKYFADLQEGKYGCSYLKRYYIDLSLLLRDLTYMDIKKMIEDLIQSKSIKS